MKRYLLKKEKWYNSNYSIYCDNELVGEYIQETFKQIQRISFYGSEFTLRKGNLWKNERFIFHGNIQIGEIIQRPFKNSTLIRMKNGGEYTVKMNMWKSLYTLFRHETAMGEFKSKSLQNILTVGDQVEHAAIAALALTGMEQKYAYVAFIALIPTFYTIFT